MWLLFSFYYFFIVLGLNKLVLTNNGFLFRTHSFHVSGEGQELEPVKFPTDALNGVPRTARPVLSLLHGEVVCAVTVCSPNRRIYTGGQGCVKIWDMNIVSGLSTSSPAVKEKPIAHFDCFRQGYYIRSCKLLPDMRTMLVGGESNMLGLWDLSTTPKLKVFLQV